MEANLVLLMLGVIVSVVGYFGVRIMTKQDELLDRIGAVKDDVHKRINTLDVRVVRLETLSARD